MGGAIEDKCHVIKLEFSESLIADFCFRHRIKESSPCAIFNSNSMVIGADFIKGFYVDGKIA